MLPFDDVSPAPSPWEALQALAGVVETAYGIWADWRDRKAKRAEAEKAEREHVDPEQLQGVLQDHEDRLHRLEVTHNQVKRRPRPRPVPARKVKG
jgi:membrane protein involved in colicin uptake